MNKTSIGWTERTWNVWSGCDPMSEGCKNCYAETLSEAKRGTLAFPNGFDLTVRLHKLDEPLRLKEPSLIFVNSMSDFFWDAVDDHLRDQMLAVIEVCPRHQFQLLTKRPERMCHYFRSRKVPRNLWLGVSVENQRNVGRIDILRDVDAAIRFVSAEPLLGPIDLDLRGLHWVITGGESGSHLGDPAICAQRGLVRRSLVRIDGRTWVPLEDRIPWVRAIRDQCISGGVSFFHKQWGGPRAGAGGRILDGRTWDEFPRVAGL